MQDDLFGDSPPTPPPHGAKQTDARLVVVPRGGVQAVHASPALEALSAAMPDALRMGVSTWSYPGWKDLVWQGDYSTTVLSRKGLSALSQHPLMRTVCVDRSFWRPLTTEQYAQMASQVPEDFRFVVKCPNIVTDALVRDEHGKGNVTNPAFMDAEMAINHFAQPCLAGLEQKIGVLVYQLSPLPPALLEQRDLLYAKLGAVLAATRDALGPHNPAIVAVEVRDPLLLEPRFAECLKTHGARFCMGLHGKMPPIERQLDFLRTLWPSPLVCRWNLNIEFGPYGYEAAQAKHAPFSEIRTPSPHTRAILARTITGITGRGLAAFVTVSNDAEGCAPLSIELLAQAIADHLPAS